jgi:hypothetical protein
LVYYPGGLLYVKLKNKSMINFDEIHVNFDKLKSINVMVLLQAVNGLLMEYANPLLFTISATGSAAYIWLKIKKEFFTKKD